jgi:hypothetical protein
VLQFLQLGIKGEGIDEGPVDGPFDMEGVASRAADEGGNDKARGAEVASRWFCDEEVGNMPAVVEETMQGATTNP